MQRRNLIVAAVGTCAAPAFAQGAKPPLRMIVGYPPGGGVDLVARTVGQRLGEVLGQNVVVDNRTGAAGTIAAEAVAKSAPDGTTLLMASPAEVMSSLIAGQKVRYDPRKDLLPVMLVGETPLVIAAHPSTPGRTMAEFIDSAKKNPGKFSYGTPGNGSTQHFAGEALKAQAGIFLLHIPYRGAAPAITDLISGQVNLSVAGLPPMVQHIKSGAVRALAVTSQKRSAVLPDVPAMAEMPGFKDFRFSNWMGVYATAGTPAATVQSIEQALTRALGDAAVREKLQQSGVEPMGLDSGRFVAFLDSETKLYSEVKQRQGVTME
jgi:tripartite-type tricarboxylate transporter receptor subunit TctC